VRGIGAPPCCQPHSYALPRCYLHFDKQPRGPAPRPAAALPCSLPCYHPTRTGKPPPKRWPARTRAAWRQVRAGIVWINAHHRNDPSSPWGGFGASGVGRENGWQALHEYTETQSIVVSMDDTPFDWFGGAKRYN